MANQRGTFAKRDREMKLKNRAKEKAERREARKADQPGGATKGPQIAWDERGGTENTSITTDAAPAPVTPAPVTPAPVVTATPATSTTKPNSKP